MNVLKEDLSADINNSIDREIIFSYPTVYVVHDSKKNRFTEKDSYSVYVGETNNIVQRTGEHIIADTKSRDDWEEFNNSTTSEMYIIGHEHFNKSMTLDVEDRMMKHLLAVESVKKLNNRRNNVQGSYYPSQEVEHVFKKIWNKLHQENSDLFPLASKVTDSAIFKASPFNKLSDEQLQAKTTIQAKIQKALESDEMGQLIIISGEAGAGKTVLLSSLFYDLFAESEANSENETMRGTNGYLLVNHDEQVKVYQQIATKLNIKIKDELAVMKPTTFINNHSENEPVDYVLVDEAHLLWTQGKQSYRGKNQLDDLRKLAKVTVIVFDEKQVLRSEQHWEEAKVHNMVQEAVESKNYIALKHQFRMHADSKTIEWVRGLVDDGVIKKLPKDDSHGYQLKVFDSVEKMYEEIKLQAATTDQGLSRVLATFDWPYNAKNNPDYGDKWLVSVGDWSLPWNLQYTETKEQKKKYKGLPWAENPLSIDEVGSTFTIQGFDLNYAGVIIGPSVKYRDNKVIFDKTASENKNATKNRTTESGQKVDYSIEHLRNELNVLLTRGVHGLYIYAVDDQLREALIKAGI